MAISSRIAKIARTPGLQRVLAGIAITIASVGIVVAAGSGAGEYQTREAFLLESLGTPDAPSDVVWLNNELRSKARAVLGHEPAMLRVRYWYAGDKTAWILEEIGKEKPITFGIVIANGSLQALRVLQFRESRGWEIRHQFFTKQFANLHLNKKDKLDRRIDSISGATLSVQAATRVATLALILDASKSKTDSTG
ncbi:MAG TPA: FMN-binding protein [Woeseiaceae bacterium]|nr:FMN-binding protein [Woeseiaceae bacterium]